MDTLSRDSQNTRRGAAVFAVAVGIVGAAVGFIESAFGPYLALLIGAAIVVLGVIVRRWDAAWSTLLLLFGAAMCAGALLYVALGLLGTSAPSSGFGTG